MTTAYEYLINQGYHDTEKSYGYDAYVHRKCSANPANKGAVYVNDDEMC